MSDFESYRLIIYADGRIIAKSPMRIGAGRDVGAFTSDLPVVRNSKGNPVIPGSSLKGFFRGNLEKILSMKPGLNVDKLLKQIFGGKEKEDLASAIFFHELPMKEGKVGERKHIRINPETGAVANLFEVECVMDGAVFEGRIFTARNLNPMALALLKTVIDATNIGFTRLGGFKSRGYGEVEIKLENLKMIFPGKNLDELKRGFEVDGLLPAEMSKIYVKGNESKISINGKEFSSKVGFNSSFFGVEAEIGEVNAFLKGMLEGVGNELL